jgi:hypothetical protein
VLYFVNREFSDGLDTGGFPHARTLVTLATMTRDLVFSLRYQRAPPHLLVSITSAILVYPPTSIPHVVPGASPPTRSLVS